MAGHALGDGDPDLKVHAVADGFSAVFLHRLETYLTCMQRIIDRCHALPNAWVARAISQWFAFYQSGGLKTSGLRVGKRRDSPASQ